MIVKDGKKIIPFYEDYKPVEVRSNNVRIAGWLTETKSGEAVDFENTYNDKVEVLVHGNSMQDGEPSPENPVPVLSAGECNLLISDRTGVRQSIALPPLRKIGDVADTYNPVTGEYVQRIGVKVFDGTEEWYIVSLTYTNQFGLNKENYFPDAKASQVPLCNVLLGRAGTADIPHAYIGITSLVCHVLKSSCPTTADWKAYLAAQYAAGTPVTVYYQLAEPIITHLDPVTVPTYYPYTRIEQDGAVKGTIEARVKVVEG